MRNDQQRYTGRKPVQSQKRREPPRAAAHNQPWQTFPRALDHTQHHEQARQIAVVRHEDVLGRFDAEIFDLFRVYGSESFFRYNRFLALPRPESFVRRSAAIAQCGDA
jgi:hypothetical protein